jgi:hypothetical protein
MECNLLVSVKYNVFKILCTFQNIVHTMTVVGNQIQCKKK